MRRRTGRFVRRATESTAGGGVGAQLDLNKRGSCLWRVYIAILKCGPRNCFCVTTWAASLCMHSQMQLPCHLSFSAEKKLARVLLSTFFPPVVNSCSLEDPWLRSFAEEWLCSFFISNNTMPRLQSRKEMARISQTLMIVCVF